MLKYSLDELKTDLFKCMITKNPIYSNRPLGNTSNIQLWTPSLIKSLYEGIVTAHDIFFKQELPLKTFARCMIAEGCQESTGNPSLGCKPIPLSFTDHTSHGFIQVTPGSVVKDYYNYGKPIMSSIDSRILLSPNTIINTSLEDPCTNILLWSIYTKNSVLMRYSWNEYINRVAWNSNPSNVTPDIGNCMYTWLAGPRNDRHTNYQPFDDYHKRVLDYYVGAQFGTKEEFEAILNIPLSSDSFPIGIYDIPHPQNKINNRDTSLYKGFV